jgi:hypothetical protein
VHAGKSITCALALTGALLGCGGTTDRASTVATTPAGERSVQRAGTITVRGDYAPDQHGPYRLHGRYRVRFTQRGAGVDFTREVPFTARLEQPVASGPARSIRLFQRAARSGTTTVRADGRFTVVVDFGDSPYEVVLTPAP